MRLQPFPSPLQNFKGRAKSSLVTHTGCLLPYSLSLVLDNVMATNVCLPPQEPVALAHPVNHKLSQLYMWQSQVEVKHYLPKIAWTYKPPLLDTTPEL